MKKYHKFIYIIILLSLFSLNTYLFAEDVSESSDLETEETEDHRFFLGMKVNAMRLNFVHGEDSDISFSFAFGALFRYLLFNYVDFMIEVDYSQSIMNNMRDIGDNKINIAADFISVPIFIGGEYTIDGWLTPYFYAGVGFDYLLSARADWPDQEDIEIQDFSTQMSEFSFFAIPVLGIAMSFNRVGTFTVEVRYHFSINSPIRTNAFGEDHLRMSNINLTIGYQFELFVPDEHEERQQRIRRERGPLDPYLNINRRYFAPDGRESTSNISFIIAELPDQGIDSYTFFVFNENGSIFYSTQDDDNDGIVVWNGINSNGEYIKSFSTYTVKAQIYYSDGTVLSLGDGEDDMAEFETGPVLQALGGGIFKIRLFDIVFDEDQDRMDRESRSKFEVVYETLQYYSEYDIVISVLVRSANEENYAISSRKATIIEAYMSVLGVQFRDIEHAGFLTPELVSSDYSGDGDVVDIYIFPRE